MDALNEQIKTVNYKHIILECLFILHNLILSSKEEDRDSVIEYTMKEYFSLLEQRLESENETFDYSFLK